MCGICGYTRLNKRIDNAVVERMKDAIIHRGPDAHGTFSNDLVVFGHRRLSIIDVGGGRQPLANEDQTVWTVANGEIYNFMDLRTDLEKKGHQFATDSDSEVLVHLYEEHGEDLVDRLVGMFAFAIWDGRQGRLLLARDRFGQKPLYYAERHGQLIFASELKGLLQHPDVETRIDPQALHRYLAYEYVPAPYSIFQEIFKLEAGCLLTWKDGQAATRRYWDFPVMGSYFQGSFQEGTNRFFDLLDQAVCSQLVSDVPLGVFLSGGLDSSTITALMARHRTPSSIKTFSIGFEEESFDESGYARQVANFIGTDHHEETVTAKSMLEIMPEVVQQFDEPFGDASAIPTYILCRHTRSQVTVALGGDGGDELLAGYDPFPAHRIAGIFSKLPHFLTEKILRNIVKRLSPSDNNMSFEFRVNKFFSHLHSPPVLRNQAWLGSFGLFEQQNLLSERFSPLQDPYQEIALLGERLRGIPDISAIIYAYVRTYLQEDILTKVDRASMAHALEVRSPFLDHPLAEFVASLPPAWKLKGLTTKFLLKKAVDKMLPQTIVNRTKKGFGIPKAKWLRENLRPLMEEHCRKDTLEQQGIFRFSKVRELMDDHFARRRDYQKELWTILMFQLWQSTFMDKISVAPCR